MECSRTYMISACFGSASFAWAIVACMRIQAELRETGQDVVGELGLFVPIALLASLFMLTRHPVFICLSVLLNLPFLLGFLLEGAGRGLTLVPALNVIALLFLAMGDDETRPIRPLSEDAAIPCEGSHANE